MGTSATQESVTKETVRVGLIVRFRDKRYVIDEVAASGFWMRRARKNGAPRKNTLRDFLYFNEARSFGVVED